MAVITPAVSRAFVKSVKLPAAPPRRRAVADEPPLQLKATEAQSLVVGSGLVVAAENVPVQIREDLINCSLFAQLVAGGTAGNSGDVARWYEAYFGALTTIGWAQSDAQFEDYEFASKNAEAHKAVIKVLTVLLGPQA